MTTELIFLFSALIILAAFITLFISNPLDKSKPYAVKDYIND